MDFYAFKGFLVKWQKVGRKPPFYAWPKEISFSSDFWEIVRKLKDFTAGDKREHEVSVFYVDGEVIGSKITSGSAEQVVSRHGVKVEYRPNQARKVYEKYVYMDGKVVKKEVVKPEKLPKKVEVEFLFNLHSHPPQAVGEKQVYSFFSPTDIQSFISSKGLLIGLVTDKLWLLGKTEKTIGKLGEVGVEKLTEFNKRLAKDEVFNIGEELAGWGIVVYEGVIGERVSRKTNF